MPICNQARRFQFLAATVLAGLIGNALLAQEALPDAYSYLPADVADLRAGFFDPPRGARPWAIWFWWNGVLAKEEIGRELDEMAAAGFGGAEIRCITFHGWGGPPLANMDDASLTRLGHRRVEYLSDEFLEFLEFACDHAESLGLRLGIVMGQGWPAGGSWIPDRYRSRVLKSQAHILEGPATYTLPADLKDRYQFAWKIDPDRRRSVLPETFVNLTRETTPAKSADVARQWAVPEGRWLIGEFHSVAGGIVDKGDGPEVDPASSEAVAFHLNHLFDRLDGRLQRFYGRTLVDVASDSWEYARGNGRYWSPQILAAFPRLAGYDLREKMHALLDFGPDSHSIKKDLEQVEAELVRQGFFVTSAKMLNARGLRHRPQVYGRGLARDFLECYAVADVPEVEQGIILPEAVWASHTVGRRVASAEAFTFMSRKHEPVRFSGGLNESTPALFRHCANYYFAEGINRLHFHSFPYSPPALPLPGWRMYAEIHANRNTPWWPHFDKLTTWMGRNQWALQAGVPVADVLVYPIASDDLEEPYRQKGSFQPVSASNGIDGANRYTLRIIRDRIAAGDYDCGSVCVLEDVATLDEAADLLEVASHAGQLICCETLPSDWSALQQSGADPLRRLIAELQASGQIVDATTRDWRAALDAVRSVRWRPGTHPLQFQHRRMGELDLYFIANFGTPFVGRVSFPGSEKRVEIWDADSGEARLAAHGIQQGDATTISLALAHAESTIVVLTDGPWPSRIAKAKTGEFSFNAAETLTGTFRTEGRHTLQLSDGSQKTVEVHLPEPIDLEGPWARRTPPKLAISRPIEETLNIDRLTTWRNIEPLRSFAGTVEYETQFEMHTSQLEQGIHWDLDLGEVYEVAVVSVNSGDPVVCWSPPYRVEVTEHLQVGQNVIRIQAANLLKNHLAEGPSYERPSGLIGPVRLMPSHYVEIPVNSETAVESSQDDIRKAK